MNCQIVRHGPLTFSCAIILFITNSDIATVSNSRLNDNNCDRTITHMAISPDSSLLATSDDASSTIDVWNLGSFSLIKTIATSEDYVTNMTFSSDNKILTWANSNRGIDGSSFNGSVYLYDLSSNSVIASLRDAADLVDKLSIQEDNKTISFLGKYPGYERIDIQVWDALSRKNIAKREAWDIAPAFSDTTLIMYLGTKLSLGITNEFSYQIEQWDGQNNIVLRKAEVEKSISALALNHDGTMIVLGNREGIISFWDTSTLTPIISFESGDSSIAHLAFIGNDQLLSVGQQENQQNIRIWNTDSQTKIFAQKSFNEPIIGKFAAESNQETLLLANGKDEPFGINLWNYKTDNLQVVKLDC